MSTILRRLRYAPLTPLRQDYAYTNFGLTAGALAVAKAAGVAWEDLAHDTLYEPLGMSSTSSRHADFVGRVNRATLHVQRDGEWVTGADRQPDAQSPAGGVSSSVTDLAQWMRLVLADGAHDGRQLVSRRRAGRDVHAARADRAARHARQPHDRDRIRHRHLDRSDGARALGAFGRVRDGRRDACALLPSEGLGIAVLTNGWPVGLAEAIGASFMDLAEQGHVTFDWLAGYGPRMEAIRQQSEPAVRLPRARAIPLPLAQRRPMPAPTKTTSTDAPMCSPAAPGSRSCSAPSAAASSWRTGTATRSPTYWQSENTLRHQRGRLHARGPAAARAACGSRTSTVAGLGTFTRR